MSPAVDYAQLVTVDESHVYFAAPQRGAVFVVPKLGGRPKALALGRDAPVALAIDATHVYYATKNAESQSRIARIDKRGGSPAVTLTRFEGAPTRLAVSEEDIVWTVDGWLYRIGKAGGTASVLRRDVCDLALHGRTLIYTQCGENGRVFRLDLRTRQLAALATSLSGPRYPVVDGENVYWITTGSEVGMRSPTLIRCCAVWTMPL